MAQTQYPILPSQLVLPEKFQAGPDETGVWRPPLEQPILPKKFLLAAVLAGSFFFAGDPAGFVEPPVVDPATEIQRPALSQPTPPAPSLTSAILTSGFISSALEPEDFVFAPGDLSDLILWLDPADELSVTLNSGNVSNILDRSGNSNDFSQATALDQPLYDTVGINGNNTIDFEADDENFLASTAAVTHNLGAGNFYFATLVNAEDFTGNHAIFTSEPGGNWTFFYVRDFIDGQRRPVTDLGVQSDTFESLSPLINTSFVFEIWRDGSSLRVRLNGLLDSNARTNSETMTDSDTLRIGGVAAFSEETDGRQGDVILTSSLPSQEERDAIMSYLAKKWAITLDIVQDWHRPFSEPLIPKPEVAAAQQSGNWFFAGDPDEFVEPGADPATEIVHPPLSEPLQPLRFLSANQLAFQIDPNALATAGSPTYEIQYPPLSEPLILEQRLPTHFQWSFDLDSKALATAGSPYDIRYLQLSEPMRLPLQLATANEWYFELDRNALAKAGSPTLEVRYRALSEPVLPLPQPNLSTGQYFGGDPAGFVEPSPFVITNMRYDPLAEPTLPAARLLTALQWSFTIDPDALATAGTPEPSAVGEYQITWRRRRRGR